MTTYDISTLETLDMFAKRLVDIHMQKNIVATQAALVTLSGNLGSGKTTLTQSIGTYLSISEEINSPTYVIEQRYPLVGFYNFNELVHIDAYRLEQEDDPIKIGLDQTLQDPTKLVIIEWPEKIQGFLEDYVKTDVILSLSEKKRVAVLK